MKFEKSPMTMTVCIPLTFSGFFLLLVSGDPPLYWLISLPALLVSAFAATLAEARDQDSTIRVKRWWNSVHLNKNEIVRIGPSFLDGISYIKLRRFALPWGRIYFFNEWSNLGHAGARGADVDSTTDAQYFFRHPIFANVVAATFGFIAGHATSAIIPTFRIETYPARIEALILIVALSVVVTIGLKKQRDFAGVALYAVTWIAGLLR